MSYRDERDALGQRFIADTFARYGKSVEERRAFSARWLGVSRTAFQIRIRDSCTDLRGGGLTGKRE